MAHGGDLVSFPVVSYTWLSVPSAYTYVVPVAPSVLAASPEVSRPPMDVHSGLLLTTYQAALSVPRTNHASVTPVL